MNTRKSSALNLRTLLLAMLCFAGSPSRAQSIPGIPEPGLIMYGSVSNTSTGLPFADGPVNWQISGGGDSASVGTTFVSVNGKSFYIARVPFETRSISGLTITKTLGTFALTTPAPTYARAATVAGTTATLIPANLSTFLFGTGDRGRIDRVDLQVTIAVDKNLDSDGDGAPDFAEAIAGTDPHDKNSVFKADTNIQPAPQGGLVIQWESVAGKTYAIYRTSDVSASFTLLQGSIAAQPPQNSYTDTTATGAGPYFYRVSVQ